MGHLVLTKTESRAGYAFRFRLDVPYELINFGQVCALYVPCAHQFVDTYIKGFLFLFFFFMSSLAKVIVTMST